jgi:hypothetical protein
LFNDTGTENELERDEDGLDEDSWEEDGWVVASFLDDFDDESKS